MFFIELSKASAKYDAIKIEIEEKSAVRKARIASRSDEIEVIGERRREVLEFHRTSFTGKLSSKKC